MSLVDVFKNTHPANNVVPVVGLAISGFIILVLVISYHYSLHLAEMHVILEEEQLESKKMQLNSELMELARRRARMTALITDTVDIFEQDDIKMELESYANRYAFLRQDLLKLPLREQEVNILNSHNKIVPVILPAQRRTIELAMKQTSTDIREAKQLLYDVVFPGQDEMINSYFELIDLEKKRIDELIRQASYSMQKMDEKINTGMWVMLGLALPFSIMVILRIRHIQDDLRESHQRLENINVDLEKKIKDRTRELSRLNQLLRDASGHDELTGLYNRRKFNEFIELEFERTKRVDTCFSLLLIDIDCFKQYNDNYGHQLGDQCLVSVAEAMSACLPRSIDFIARYGGEEFVVVLPSTSQEGAKRVAEHLRKTIANLKIPHDYSVAGDFVTISQGIAVFNAGDRQSINDVIGKADQCLYQAKSNGRNRIESHC